MRRVLLGAAVIGASALGWYVLGSHSDEAKATSNVSSDRTRVASEREESEELDEVPIVKSERPSDVAVAASAQPISKEQSPKATEVDDPDGDAAARDALVATDLEARVKTGGPPSPRTRSAETTIRNAFRSAGLPPGTNLLSMECRGDSCQVAMQARDFRSYKKAIEHMFLDPATSVTVDMNILFPSQEALADGSYRSTFYLVSPDYVPPI